MCPDQAGPHRRIILTGGGTAGHVMPNLALAPELRRRGWDILYIASRGPELETVQRSGLDFRIVACGKLRRYASWRHWIEPFRILLGLLQSLVVLARWRPRVVFSKGGYVAVPPCLAARLLGIPVVTHESDVTPGLANRLIALFAARILYSFPETFEHLPHRVRGRAKQTGAPVRQELLIGDRRRGAEVCRFAPGQHESDDLPVLLVMGGSLGAERLNQALGEVLPHLCESYRVVHLTGRGKRMALDHPNYRQFEFVAEAMGDLLAFADLVVSRAGAGSVFELSALAKPMLLVPLVYGSRGDQVLNAQSLARRGAALVLDETTMDGPALEQAIARLRREAPALRAVLQREGGGSSEMERTPATAIRTVVDEIEAVAQ